MDTQLARSARTIGGTSHRWRHTRGWRTLAAVQSTPDGRRPLHRSPRMPARLPCSPGRMPTSPHLTASTNSASRGKARKHAKSNERSRRSYRPPLPPEGASLVIRPAAPPVPTITPAAGHLLDSTPSGSSLLTEPLSAADRRCSHAKDEVWKMPTGLRKAAQRMRAL